MLILECVLQWMELVAVRQIFHSLKLGAVGLYRKHETGTHRVAIE